LALEESEDGDVQADIKDISISYSGKLNRLLENAVIDFQDNPWGGSLVILSSMGLFSRLEILNGPSISDLGLSPSCC
jgi:hypothetical protein